MFPLQKRILIRGCKAHVKAGLGCAADYEADHEPVYMPFDGTIKIFSTERGGNWIQTTRDDNGDVIQQAHIDRYLQTSGHAKEGELIAVTGNTGTLTTGPHDHLQIKRNGKRVDPERYDWKSDIIDNVEQKLKKRISELVKQVKRLQGVIHKDLTPQVHKYKAAYERVQKAYGEQEAELLETRGQVEKFKNEYGMCKEKKLEEMAEALTWIEKLALIFKRPDG